MLRLFFDKIKAFFGESKTEMGIMYKDDATSGKKGVVFFEIKDANTGEILEKRHIENVVTLDMSILLAWLIASTEDSNPPTHGIHALAVGTGDPSWNLGASDSPDPADEDQRSLFSEIERKPFSEVHFVDSDGNHVDYPTHIVDFTTIFDVGEASGGALVEMGLLGGDVDLNTPNPLPNGSPRDPTIDVDDLQHDILCNYLTFKPINKPTSAIMTITWRITF